MNVHVEGHGHMILKRQKWKKEEKKKRELMQSDRASSSSSLVTENPHDYSSSSAKAVSLV